METYIGYVVGWRWWALDPLGLLRSLHMPHSSPRAWNWYHENFTEPPELDGSSGFHAYMPHAIEHQPGAVVGTVALYGDLCRHAHGYRAEKARVLDAWCAPEHWEHLEEHEQVRGVYFVDIEDGDEWLKLVNLKEKSDTNPSLIQFPFHRIRLKRPAWTR